MNQPLDMARFIEAKSDQLNADDLIGTQRTITITKVTGSDGDQPVAIFYEGDNGKPFKPCKTIRRVLMGVWGRYADEYVGKSMTLYRDNAVTFGGLQVGGIRISHMSHIDKDMTVVVMKSKGKKAGMKIMPLVADAAPKQGLTIDQARADIQAASNLDDLKTVWSRKSMAPYREALQGELDTRKAALSVDTVTDENPAAVEGRTDEQHGDQNDDTDEAPYAATVTEILQRIANAGTPSDAKAVQDDWLKHSEALPDDENVRIGAALDARLGELKKGAGA